MSETTMSMRHVRWSTKTPTSNPRSMPGSRPRSRALVERGAALSSAASMGARAAGRLPCMTSTRQGGTGRTRAHRDDGEEPALLRALLPKKSMTGKATSGITGMSHAHSTTSSAVHPLRLRTRRRRHHHFSSFISRTFILPLTL